MDAQVAETVRIVESLGEKQYRLCKKGYSCLHTRSTQLLFMCGANRLSQAILTKCFF